MIDAGSADAEVHGLAGHGLLPRAETPFPVQVPHRVTPAPKPLHDWPGVQVDDAWPAAVRRRVERLANDAGGVVVPSPGLEDDGAVAAVQAAWDLLPGRLGALPHLGLEVDVAGAQVLRRTGPGRDAPASDLLVGRSGLDLLVTGWLLACSDDLVVLHRTGAGELSAELLAVAFPSGWPPRQLAGASLRALHAPVADGERLQRAAPALSEALLTKGPLRQYVWGFDPTGRLDRDPSAPDAEPWTTPEPGRWWLRVERQTSVPLPELDRALFLIRPYLRPLTAFAPDQRRTLADAVETMSPQTLAYKGIDEVAVDLVAWLRAEPGQFSVGSAG